MMNVDRADRDISTGELAALLRAGQDGVIVIDSQGKILDCNPTAASMMGYAQEELLKGRIADLIPPEMRDAHVQGLRRYLDTGESRVIGVGATVEALRKDGRRVPITLSIEPFRSGNDMRFLGVLHDRTVQVEMDALFEAAVDGVLVIDGQGTIIRCNQAACNMLGLSLEAMRSREVFSFFPENRRQEFMEQIKTYLREGPAEGIGVELDLLDDSGDVVPVLLTIGRANLPDEERFLGILRDLRQQRAVAKKEKMLESQLKRVEQLQMLGEFTAGIAHEINQPLAAISTYASAGVRLTETGKTSLEEVNGIFHSMSNEALRAADVVRNLRQTIRNQPATKASLAPNEVIRDIMNLIRADAASADVRVVTHLASNLPNIRGNATQLQQVLLNLTHNAIEAMQHSEEGNDHTVSLSSELTESGLVRLSVSDNGPGLDQSLEPDVFRPFVTSKADGLGVGLAISHKIVEAHQGSLRHIKNHDGGATFQLELPAFHDRTVKKS